jgi:hypothetical protein
MLVLNEDVVVIPQEVQSSKESHVHNAIISTPGVGIEMTDRHHINQVA